MVFERINQRRVILVVSGAIGAIVVVGTAVAWLYTPSSSSIIIPTTLTSASSSSSLADNDDIVSVISKPTNTKIIIKKQIRRKLSHLEKVESLVEGFFPNIEGGGSTNVHEIDIHGNDTIDDTNTNNSVNQGGFIDGTDDVTTGNNININAYDDPTIIEAMVQQLRPREIRFTDETNTTWDKHQFLHLHHMKTGGTSMDVLLNCAKSRYMVSKLSTIQSMSIHECSEARYESCVKGTDANCRNAINAASVLSYCAPLKDLQDPFGWTEVTANDPKKINAVTVFRHPVARAWSMYRYATKRCYNCRSLKDVYSLIDQNSTEIKPMCRNQLQNHLTRNVLSNESITDATDRVNNAITNMKSFFTLVGLTEDMTTTAAMVGKVFPWLAETIDGSDKICAITRANKSPQNNRCGPHDSHMPIPDEPDEETAQLILLHNQLDMELYDAAVEQFRIQKLALKL